MVNTFPRWKNIVLLVTVLISLIYALPNFYGDDPAIQISGLQGNKISQDDVDRVESILDKDKVDYKSIELDDGAMLVRFSDTEVQLKTKDLVRAHLNDEEYAVALNLAPVTPVWLDSLGAKPMKLGLDLRGGVHFLMEVDVASNIERRLDSYHSDIKMELREAKVRYSKFFKRDNETLVLSLGTEVQRDEALAVLKDKFRDLDVIKDKQGDDGSHQIRAKLPPNVVQEIRNYTLEQTMATLRNRVNELGVAEAIVQRQGMNRVIVQLPGIQDTARAKDILGKTATLKFMMHDSKNELPAPGERVPPGSKVYQGKEGIPRLLKNRVILTGESISSASTGTDEHNLPTVNIRLGGGGTRLFKQTTRDSIGQFLAVVYVETKMVENIEDGKIVRKPKTIEKVISFARINSALGNGFMISGLGVQEARDLALLLRAGALPANLSIVEERIVGPSMGQENIKMGMISLISGLGLVLVCMAIYYSVFGLIANIALLVNLSFIVAIMSVLGATLTLPAIAGVVLTLGMAVDANVLIFERIREELRQGMSPQASIHRGFDKAFGTIVDANITTLISGIILLAIGIGPIKGFAVTLSIGILTSMFTAVTITRAIVNLAYGRRNVKTVLVGI